MNERDIQPAGQIEYTEIDKLFSQLTAQEVEQFYATYQLWVKRQKAARLQQEIQTLRTKQAQNTEQIQAQTPSAIALAAIAQLRACGVEDIDLLDRMLERGEDWLDNTMQLLSRCEALNVIQGNYTQWCEHALEGAYEWMWSMNDVGLSNYFEVELPATQPDENAPAISDSPSTDNAPKVTEDQLLRKLMSEPGGPEGARQTKPLPPTDEEEKLDAATPFIATDQSEPPVEEQIEAASETASSEETFPVDIPPALVELLGAKADSQTAAETAQAVEHPVEAVTPAQELDSSASEQATTESLEQEEEAEESMLQELTAPDQTDALEPIPVEEPEISPPADEMPSTIEPTPSAEVQQVAVPDVSPEQIEEAVAIEEPETLSEGTAKSEETTEYEQPISEPAPHIEDTASEQPLTAEDTLTEDTKEQTQVPADAAEPQNPVHENLAATPVPGEPASTLQQLEEPLAKEEKADKPHATNEETQQGLLARWLARIFGR